MDLVEDLADPCVSVAAACAALGVSRATLYRATAPSAPPAVRGRAPSPRRLSDDERQAIVNVMHAPEFMDQPPMEVFAKLLSRGVYVASIRTIYRVLAELGESKERRNQRLPQRQGSRRPDVCTCRSLLRGPTGGRGSSSPATILASSCWSKTATVSGRASGVIAPRPGHLPWALAVRWKASENRDQCLSMRPRARF